MALTLTDALAAPTTLAPAIRLTITGTVPDAIEAGYLFRLEDEALELKYFGKAEETILGGAATQTVDDRSVWYAQRGVAGTAIVSHAATTAVKGVADALLAGTTEVVPAPPFGSPGGTSDHTALTNRDAADQHPQSAITDLEADLAAAGEPHTLAATLAEGNDTGGLGITHAPASGDANADISANAIGGNGVQRNSNTFGDTANGNTSVSAVNDGNAVATIAASASGLGTALANAQADSVDSIADATAIAVATGTGDADARRTATAASGDAHAEAAATTGGAGTADARSTATAAGGTASIGPIADATTARIMVTGLPTSDPAVAGQVWNNAGVLMVSAG